MAGTAGAFAANSCKIAAGTVPPASGRKPFSVMFGPLFGTLQKFEVDFQPRCRPIRYQTSKGIVISTPLDSE